VVPTKRQFNVEVKVCLEVPTHSVLDALVESNDSANKRKLVGELSGPSADDAAHDGTVVPNLDRNAVDARDCAQLDPQGPDAWCQETIASDKLPSHQLANQVLGREATQAISSVHRFLPLVAYSYLLYDPTILLTQRQLSV
jgi:hypothetical protein